MSTLYFLTGFLSGIFLGVGLSIFYLRWKVKTQLTGMQDQMEEMMDITEDLNREEE